MRSMCIAAVLLSVLAVGAVGVTAQSTLTGKWRTVALPRQPGDRTPKMVGEVLLDLKVEGEKLTGTATMSERGYPGSAPVQNGKIEGNRFSFSWTGNVEGCNINYCDVPRLTFTGTVDGDQMMLSMDGSWKMGLKGERLPPQ